MKKEERRHENVGAKGAYMNENIYLAYRMCVRWLPTLLMLCHWLLAESVHGVCGDDAYMCGGLWQMAGLYVMAYVLPFGLLPAMMFWGYGMVWRIPFVYLAGVNVVRLSSGTWLMCDATASADMAVVAVTALLYAWCVVRRLLLWLDEVNARQ